MLGKMPVVTVKERLRWQGFNEDYQLVGDIKAQIEQIQTAFPPPMSKAFASSFHEQIDAVKEKLAELQTQQSVINVNKRKPDEDAQSGSPKKLRWRQESWRE
jgi:hypothetical protein